MSLVSNLSGPTNLKASSFQSHSLLHDPKLSRNRLNLLCTSIAALFAAIAVIPLFLVLFHVLVQGGRLISLDLLTQLPPPPGLTGGGIGNALLGTLIITVLASLIAIPFGVGGGIYLAEYSQSGMFSKFIRFGNNVLAGVPSIISGVFVYGLIVSTRLILNQSYSALAGSIALAVLMLPTIIKTTDEGLKLVPNDLRFGAYGIGASTYITITQVTLPAALTPIATGVVLAVARAAGETAPLIFTALFSPFWPQGVFQPIASMSVLIYNYSIMPYATQQQLAWVASFVLIIVILAANLLARCLGRMSKSQL